MKLRLLAALIVAAASVASPAAGSSSAVRSFVTPGAGGVSCEMGLHRPSLHPATYVFCQSYQGPLPYQDAAAVTMSRSAKLKVCRGLKCIGNSPNPPPRLEAGHSIVLGPFRCTSLRNGVRCVVRRLGHGFRLSTTGLQRIR